MAKVATYLNFQGNTEEAFLFYKSVFGTEFFGQIFRFSGIPAMEGMPPIAEAEQNFIMHICLPILGGHLLMGTDASESMGHKLKMGNNVSINLLPDSVEEGQRLFDALSAGGKVTMPFSKQFWGDTYGACTDQFGLQWMVDVPEASPYSGKEE
ncbi:MAG: VOC family protein [Bacteroidetes bacterium]|nr:VOC family protein [Bacteroidota bacterium]MBS1628874.1 VOC family protein [Bacteroidota bacterium]